MIISKIEKLDSLFSDESSKRTRRRDFSVHKKKDDEQGSGGAGTDNKLASISTPGTISNISTCQWISPDKTPSLFLIDEDKQCLSIDINTALALITDKVIPELENVFIYKDNKYLILDINALLALYRASIKDKATSIDFFTDKDKHYIIADRKAATYSLSTKDEAISLLENRLTYNTIGELMENDWWEVNLAAANALIKLDPKNKALAKHEENLNYLYTGSSYNFITVNDYSRTHSFIQLCAKSKYISGLERFLYHKDPYVARDAVQLLVRFGVTDKVLPILESHLSSKCPALISYAAEYMGKVGAKERAIPILKNHLSDKKYPYTVIAAAEALHRFGIKDEVIAHTLIELLQDKSEFVIKNTASTLCSLDIKEAIPELEKHLWDKERHVVRTVVQAIDGLDGTTKKSFDALKKLLNQEKYPFDNAMLMRELILLYAKNKDIPALEDLLLNNYDSDAINYLAKHGYLADTLVQFLGKKAIPMLELFLDHKEPWAIYYTAKELIEFGAKGQAMPALEKLYKHSNDIDNYLRLKIEEVLNSAKVN